MARLSQQPDQSLARYLVTVCCEAMLYVLPEPCACGIVVQDTNLAKQLSEDHDGIVFDASPLAGDGRDISSAHRWSSFGTATAVMEGSVGFREANSELDVVGSSSKQKNEDQCQDFERG
jgi:hypothetical protein